MKENIINFFLSYHLKYRLSRQFFISAENLLTHMNKLKFYFRLLRRDQVSSGVISIQVVCSELLNLDSLMSVSRLATEGTHGSTY